MKENSEPPPWSESDTKAVVDSMTRDMLHGPHSQWLPRWKKTHEGSPTLLIGPNRNKTMQSIDEDLVGKDLKKSIRERSALSSDSIQVIRDKEFLCQIREERTSACGRSRLLGPDVLQGLKERGVDFILYGTIRSDGNDHPPNGYANRQDERPKSTSYSVYLGILNVETDEKAWVGGTEIKTNVYWRNSSPRSPEDSENCDSVARMDQC